MTVQTTSRAFGTIHTKEDFGGFHVKCEMWQWTSIGGPTHGVQIYTPTQTIFERHKQTLYVHYIHSFLLFSFLFLFVYLAGCEVKSSLVPTLLFCFLQVSDILPVSWCPLHHIAGYCSRGKKFTDFIIYRNRPLWSRSHENRLLFWCSQLKVRRYVLGKCFLWPYEQLLNLFKHCLDV